MAFGDNVIFDQYSVDLGNKIHDMDTDTFKLAFLTASAVLADTTAVPHFGGSGTTDLSVNEVTPGGNYPAGGVILTGLTYTNTAGVVTWTADKVLIAQNAANPTNARWVVIYNDTDVNKRAICFFDLASDRDLSAGPYEQRFNGVDGNGAILTHTTNA